MEENELNALWGFIDGTDEPAADGFIGFNVPPYDDGQQFRLEVVKALVNPLSIVNMPDELFERFMTRLNRINEFVTGDQPTTIET